MHHNNGGLRMSTLKFKCTLLSDVILNQKAATEGPNKTLDFIPGSCFLGIVASELYPENSDDKEKMTLAMKLFHSGKVRFGDAHPSKEGIRGLKIPASMFYPKLQKVSEECYIHHEIPEQDLESDDLKKKQLKQCRSGFYVFSDKIANVIKTDTNFAIKSAYDKDKRRSEDERMYGYESLQKGLVLYFDVEVDDENFESVIKDSLTDKNKRVGRSRTAQYGLVEIKEVDSYYEIKSKKQSGKYVTVYADGRLIFLDDYGMPTFRPTPEKLGFTKDAKIIWEKSQIRTFQYSPWNFKRQCFDTDRCGIEKGSVFVVETTQDEFKSKYVGSYNNEGFGKVIYNPEFLDAEPNGKACFKINDEKESDETDKKGSCSELKGTTLLQYISNQIEKEKIESDIYARVNHWADDNIGRFKGDVFASQWGKIRSIAMVNSSLQALKNELLDKKKKETRIQKDGNKKEIEKPNAYLTHGVAADKWAERGRKKAFEDFINGFSAKGVDRKFDALTDKNAQNAIINLAAMMAKRCKEGK